MEAALLNRFVCFRASAITPAFAEACLQFSPQVALRADGTAVFIEIASCRRLFSESELSVRLHALARRFGFSGEVAGGPTPARALAHTRFRDPLPLEALQDFLSPFGPPSPELSREIADLVRALRQLGIGDVPAFLALPSQTLASRFGKSALRIVASIQGEVQPAWPGFRAPERVRETIDTECENLEALIFVLRAPVDRAMARLRGRGERAATVRLELEFEKWSGLRESKRDWRLELPLSQGSASGILPILQEQLSADLQRRGLPAPVMKILFEVVEAVPGRGSQRDFFSRKEDEQENWDALLGRLSHKLGKDRVFVALPVERYLPEKAYRRVLKTEDAPLAVPLAGPRPSRLLKRPWPLEKQGTLLSDRRGRRWHSLEWQGPERLTGEWWRETSFQRDYYRVVTSEGAHLWIFVDHSGDASAVYLHGYFD